MGYQIQTLSSLYQTTPSTPHRPWPLLHCMAGMQKGKAQTLPYSHALLLLFFLCFWFLYSSRVAVATFVFFHCIFYWRQVWPLILLYKRIWAFVGQISFTGSNGSWTEFALIFQSHSAEDLYFAAGHFPLNFSLSPDVSLDFYFFFVLLGLFCSLVFLVGLWALLSIGLKFSTP